jgi:hypothetical protein
MPSFQLTTGVASFLVAHEDAGMNLAAGFPAGLTQGFHKAMAIPVIAKNGLAVITPGHDVVNRAGIFNA